MTLLSTNKKRFSLILASKGRDIELVRFFENLILQTYKNYELIIIDQNQDDRIRKIINSIPGINIIYLQSEPGLSKARNIGLNYATGEIISFPDDDCWYEKHLLEQVNQLFLDNPKNVVFTGRTMSEKKQKKLWKWDAESGYVNKINIWKRANSNSIFINKALLKEPIIFDEKLGIGSGTPFGSGEEIDLLLKILFKGGTIKYEPEIIVYHEDIFDEKAMIKAYSYACGMGYVLRKHHYPIWTICKYLLMPFLSTIRSVLKGDIYHARFMWSMCRGRIFGIRNFQ